MSRRSAFVPKSLRRTAPRPIIILVTDPGPDPDDVKVLIAATVAHIRGDIVLRCVVCNGGGAPSARARLARCVLDHLRAYEVPVGVGSAGETRTPYSYEYNLDGYHDVDNARLIDGTALIDSVLQNALPRSLTWLLISSLRDFVDAVAREEELVCSKTKRVAIMGGLQRVRRELIVPDPDCSPNTQETRLLAANAWDSWEPDSSQNNVFDRQAASVAYSWCFRRGVPMIVTSRHVVPPIPMELAISFASRTCCPLLKYLAAAQEEGLKGLWIRLCHGELPARCSKRWYFESFCGTDASTFSARDYDGLGPDADMTRYLHGSLKPYDVVCLMTVLPATETLFRGLADSVFAGGAVHHLLHDPAKATVGSAQVQQLLYKTYQHASAITASHTGDELAGEKVHVLRGIECPRWKGCSSHHVITDVGTNVPDGTTAEQPTTAPDNGVAIRAWDGAEEKCPASRWKHALAT
mmetsp:Transcript_13660/g.36568  ORF Transcript_13660/g.36568 Transcript_13660/m.36568 type:complete len:466 (+) Transcript_13660:84-1481(+)